MREHLHTPTSGVFFDAAPGVVLTAAVTPTETLPRPDKLLSPAEQLLVKGVETVTTNEGFVRWLDVAAKFHHYSLHNQLLIAMQDPDATKVMGFKKWGEVGRHVKKGEHGIKILYPQFHAVDEEDPDTGEVKTTRLLRGFGIGTVFDARQTEGEELPEGPVFGDLNEPNAIAREVNLRLSRWLIDEGLRMESKDFPGHAHGYFSPTKRAIVMRRSVTIDEHGEMFPSGDPLNLMKTKTLTHEAAHYLAGHLPDEVSKEAAEIEAEGAAYIALKHFDLDSSSYSFPYLGHWGATPDNVKKHLQVISDVAKTIVIAVEQTEPFPIT